MKLYICHSSYLASILSIAITSITYHLKFALLRILVLCAGLDATLFSV